MAELDFGNIYSCSGQLLQLSYAQKAVNAGSTILAICNSKGAVLLVSKPVVSKLHVMESNTRILKISENACITYTGLLSDGILVTDLCKRHMRPFRNTFEREPTAYKVKEALETYLYMFTRHTGGRPLGACFLVILRDGGEYKVLLGENTGRVLGYRACAAGSGERRVTTELEKGEFEDMEIADMIDYGIKTMYKCHDPLSESVFVVEGAMISEDSDGKFVRITREVIDSCVEKYKNISMDEDGE